MITRSKDVNDLKHCTGAFKGVFDAQEWMDNDDNYLLTDGEGNFGLIVYNLPKVYCAHYFFEARGKEAKRITLEMLDYAFTNFEVEVMFGLTPLVNRAARWMTRQVGFKSHGAVNTDLGPCELFVLTKKEHME